MVLRRTSTKNSSIYVNDDWGYFSGEVQEVMREGLVKILQSGREQPSGSAHDDTTWKF